MHVVDNPPLSFRRRWAYRSYPDPKKIVFRSTNIKADPDGEMSDYD